MLSLPALALAVTALLAGVTGAWSPCGFSMVDTLGEGGRRSGRATLAVACGTFALGAMLGGAATFGGLAGAGWLLHTGGKGLAGAAAVGVLFVAALAELRGVRIRPQVRRQVPEPWRRTMPLALAAGLYGVLLGLGFTTFVLTLAVSALAAVCLALGDPVLGLLVGGAFGVGRAIPVVLLAPVHDRPAGFRALELMAGQPRALRGLRVADGLALCLCALALGTGSASAARRVASPASDPSVAAGELAWDGPDGRGVLRSADGRTAPLPGSDPALGGPFLGWRNGDELTVVRRDTGQEVVKRVIAGLGELALSSSWVVAHSSVPGHGETLQALRLDQPGAVRIVAARRGGLGRPDLDGDRLAYDVAGRRGSRIVEVNLRTGRRVTVARSRSAQLLNPSLAGRRIAYVSIGRCGQRLVLRRGRRVHTLMRSRPLAGADVGYERGHTHQGSGYGACPRRGSTHTMLWTTALSPRFAYVTALPTEPGSQPSILEVGR